MATNLGPLYISSSFQQLVTVSASAEGNILANGTGSVFIPISASHAISASYADSVVSASHAVQADNATSASRATSAASADTATSASHAVNADNAISASHALNADNAISASHALNADDAISSSYALSSSYAVSASHAVRADGSGTAEDLIITVKNVSTSTIAAGVPVYANGVTGENVNVVTASNDSALTMPAIGITQNSINANGNGIVVISGRESGINTSALSAGQPVYVGLNGTLISNKPTGTALIQNIGTAAKIDAVDGEIIIQGAGRTNDLPNILEGYAWVGNFNGVPTATPTSSFVSTTPNIQEVLTAGNSASVDLILSSSLIQSGSNFDVHSDNITFRNSASSAPELIILDEQNESFSVGPKIKFSGSRVGIIESNRNLKIDVVGGGDMVFNAGNQYLFTKNNFQSGDYKIDDNGSRTAYYKHENLTETGSITFANTTTDLGIGIKMTDDYAGLQFYSGSAYKNVIAREANGRVKIYDGSNATGSAGTPLMVDNNPLNNGALKWGAPYFDSGVYNFFGNGQLTFSTSAGGFSFIDIGNAAKPVISSSYAVSASHLIGGGGGAAFPFTGSADITGSLQVTGSVIISGSLPELNVLDGKAKIGYGHGGSGNYNISVGIGHTNNATAGVAMGSGHTVNGDTSTAIGGENNTINSNYCTTIGGSSGQINNGDLATIVGGYQNNIGGAYTTIVGGVQNVLENGATFGAIVGGYRNRVVAAATGSVVIGGTQVTASVHDTVFMPNLHTKNTFGLGSTMSGSLSLEGLPTTDVGLAIGDVWISGSNTNPGSANSGYLMIKTS